MANITDRTSGNDIRDITLMNLWSRGMSLGQIAKETGLSVASVCRRLKAMQKVMIKKETEIEDNEKKGNI